MLDDDPVDLSVGRFHALALRIWMRSMADLRMIAAGDECVGEFWPEKNLAMELCHIRCLRRSPAMVKAFKAAVEHGNMRVNADKLLAQWDELEKKVKV